MAKTILIYMERASFKEILSVHVHNGSEISSLHQESLLCSDGHVGSVGDSWDNPKAPSGGGNSNTSNDPLFGCHGLELSALLHESLQL